MTGAECPNCRCRDMGGADQWHEDGKGFRKGRWVVAKSRDGALWLLTHDEAGQLANVWVSITGNGIVSSNPESRLALEGFLTWHAATYPKQPTEPTRSGYVGTLASEYGSHHHVYRYYSASYGHAYRIVGLAGGSEACGLSWGVVLQAGTFTAVTS